MRIYMGVFFIHFYIYILGSRGSMVSVIVQQPEDWRFNPHSPLKKRIGGLTARGVAVHLLVTAEVPFIYMYACLYACFFHVFLCLYLGQPWRSGECGRPITRGLVVQSPLTAQKKDWWADSWRVGS